MEFIIIILIMLGYYFLGYILGVVCELSNIVDAIVLILASIYIGITLIFSTNDFVSLYSHYSAYLFTFSAAFGNIWGRIYAKKRKKTYQKWWKNLKLKWSN